MKVFEDILDSNLIILKEKFKELCDQEKDRYKSNYVEVGLTVGVGSAVFEEDC